MSRFVWIGLLHLWWKTISGILGSWRSTPWYAQKKKGFGIKNIKHQMHNLRLVVPEVTSPSPHPFFLNQFQEWSHSKKILLNKVIATGCVLQRLAERGNRCLEEQSRWGRRRWHLLLKTETGLRYPHGYVLEKHGWAADKLQDTTPHPLLYIQSQIVYFFLCHDIFLFSHSTLVVLLISDIFKL